MPEISESDYRQFVAYQGLGTIGEIQKKIGDLEKDNGKQRERMKELEAAQLKPDQVAVPKADAEALEQYRALGKPDELKTVKEERDQLQAKDAQRTREDAFRGALKSAGLDEEIVPTLLALLPEETKLEERTEKQGEQDVKVPYVTLPGEGQKPVKLTELPTADPRFRGVRFEAASGTEPERRIERGQPFAGRQSGDGAPPKKERTPDDVRKAVETTANYTL